MIYVVTDKILQKSSSDFNAGPGNDLIVHKTLAYNI